MKDLTQLLGEQPLFEGLDPDHLAFLAGCGQLVHVADGEIIFAEGTTADRCYVVRAGRVVVGLHAPQGPVGIGTLEPGELLGWSWLHPPHRWHLDAMAAGETSLIAFDAGCLRQKFETDSRLGYQIMSRLAEMAARRLQATRIQLLDLYSVPKDRRP